MSRMRIAVIGGGFAGIEALRTLSRHRRLWGDSFEVVLFDRKEYFEFLPLLPDVLSRRMDEGCLRVGLRELSRTMPFTFIQSEVTRVDMGSRSITYGSQETMFFEFLIIASGSETNFFGNEALERACFRLDTVDNAIRIREAVLKGSRERGNLNVVVIGGGYTGIEVASNMQSLLKRSPSGFRVMIVEKAPELLTMVPGWLRNEAADVLKKDGIDIVTGDSLKDYDGSRACLESGRVIETCVCVWTAGVKTPRFVEGISLEKVRTRIAVDERLGISRSREGSIFIAGDSAAFVDARTHQALRMAVMFSIGQGRIAAENVVRMIGKRPLIRYVPKDLGYLIPLASGRAPGIILGRRINGRIGYRLHYLMCLYRSALPNQIKMLQYWMNPGRSSREG